MAANDKLHKIIAQQFIDLIEAGMVDGKWTAPWDKFASDLPMNFTSNRAYNGINIFKLWFAGFQSSYWGTYKQWKEAGAQVRKGEQGTMIVFWKILKKKDAKNDKDTFPMLRYFKVFNAEQVDGWEAPQIVPTRVHDTNAMHDECKAIISATGADIRHGGNRAMYVPSLDRIQLPEFYSFHSADYYYQTAFHELIHWTGHDSRLDRTFGQRFGDHAYALEELAAELGAAIIGAKIGIEPNTRTDHARYIKHWIKALNDEPSCLMNVASKANKAVNYIIDGAESIEVSEAA